MLWSGGKNKQENMQRHSHINRKARAGSCLTRCPMYSAHAQSALIRDLASVACSATGAGRCVSRSATRMASVLCITRAAGVLALRRGGRRGPGGPPEAGPRLGAAGGQTMRYMHDYMPENHFTFTKVHTSLKSFFNYGEREMPQNVFSPPSKRHAQHLFRLRSKTLCGLEPVLC